MAIPYFVTKFTEEKGGDFLVLSCRGDFTDPVLRVAMEYYVLSLRLILYSTFADSNCYRIKVVGGENIKRRNLRFPVPASCPAYRGYTGFR
jgi:hypothetical protein